MPQEPDRFPLTKEGIKQALAAARKPSRGQRRRFIDSLKAQLQEFERRYRLRTEELRAAVRSGRLHEDADIAKWLLALDALERSEAARDRSHDQ